MANPYDAAGNRLQGVTLMNRSGHFVVSSKKSHEDNFCDGFRARVALRVSRSQKEIAKRPGSTFHRYASRPTEAQASELISRIGWWIVHWVTDAPALADRVFPISPGARQALVSFEPEMTGERVDLSELLGLAVGAVDPSAGEGIMDMARQDREAGIPSWVEPDDAVLWPAMIVGDLAAFREHWAEVRHHLEGSPLLAQPTVAGSGDTDVAASLRALKTLLEDGLIDQADYSQKKAELLGRL